MLSFMFQKGRSSCFYENRLKEARLVGKPSWMNNNGVGSRVEAVGWTDKNST